MKLNLAQSQPLRTCREQLQPLLGTVVQNKGSSVRSLNVCAICGKMVFRLSALPRFCCGMIVEAHSQAWEELGSQPEEQATGGRSLGGTVTGCEILCVSLCFSCLSIRTQTTALFSLLHATLTAIPASQAPANSLQSSKQGNTFLFILLFICVAHGHLPTNHSWVITVLDVFYVFQIYLMKFKTKVRHSSFTQMVTFCIHHTASNLVTYTFILETFLDLHSAVLLLFFIYSTCVAFLT